MPASYESWFVEKHGMRPIVDANAQERIAQLEYELARLQDAVERRRRWDADYMAGRAALDTFGRRDV
jgi:hypothetical protein